MTITRLESNNLMSAVVSYNKMAFLAGQVGENGGDITKQTQDALAEVDRLLASVNSDKSMILSATIWLSDMRYFEAMNAVWEKWVDPNNTPARATGEAKLASPDYLVEIIVTAATR